MPSEVEDKLEIQQLAQTYADGVMQRDVDIWGSTFAEDGEWSLPGMEKPLKGRETLKPFWSKVMVGYPYVLHWVQPGIIKVTGDKATARFYVQENIRDAQGGENRVAGVYDDELVRENGHWKFASRKFAVLYRGPTDLSGTFAPYSGGAIF